MGLREASCSVSALLPCWLPTGESWSYLGPENEDALHHIHGRGSGAGWGQRDQEAEEHTSVKALELDRAPVVGGCVALCLDKHPYPKARTVLHPQIMHPLI